MLLLGKRNKPVLSMIVCNVPQDKFCLQIVNIQSVSTCKMRFVHDLWWK